MFEANTISQRKRAYAIGMQGQSNRVGSVDNVVIDSKYQNPNPNAYIVGLMNSANPNQNEITTFQPLSWGDNGTGNTFLGNIHGSEPSLAYELRNTPVYFIKVAEGATDLATDWADGSLLRDKYYEYLNYAKAYFEANNIDPIWIQSRNQWESDANDTTRATNWGANLDAFDADLLAQTGIVWDKYIHIKPSENPQNSFYNSYTSNVNLMLDYLTAREENEDNFYLLDVDDLPLRDEGLFLHQDSAGQIEIGRREAQIIKAA